MTSRQNQSIAAVPNMLRDQTLPNTLGGLGSAATAAPFRIPAGAIAAAAIAALAVLMIVLGRLG